MRGTFIVFIVALGLAGPIITTAAAEKSTEMIPEETLQKPVMQKKIISILGAPKPMGPYNPVIQFGQILYISGQLGIDVTTGKLISNDVQNQTQQALLNIQALLNVAGSDLTKLLQCRIFLTDINDFRAMNQVYASFFSSTEYYPVRTALAVAALPANGRVEIECTAYTLWSLASAIPRNSHGSLVIPSHLIVLSVPFYLLSHLFSF